MKQRGIKASNTLTIGDFMDLGFDPTRLKEITIDGKGFIFERIQARQLPDLKRKKEMLNHLTLRTPGLRAQNAKLRVNPPLVAIRDRGNAYVLRHKVSGIHWEEAVEQLQGSSHLKRLNASMKIDKTVVNTVHKANEIVAKHLGIRNEKLFNMMAFFVSWDLKSNQPKLMVDVLDTFLESIWIA
jgi:hypothetical protein